MTDTNKLKELAERATPGPWSCNRHWAIVGGPILEFTNGAAQQQIAMACGQSWMHDEELRNNAEWIAAANPAAVLELIAEVERLRKVDALQKQVNEHYKTWYRECIDEPFDTWLKDDATHWIGEQDAAFQAWQYLHENKIWLMKERIDEHEQELDRLKAENEALRLAGRDLSNIAYNLAQKTGHALTEYECELLSSLRKKWDEALAANRKALTVKRCPTCPGTCAEICAKARP